MTVRRSPPTSCGRASTSRWPRRELPTERRRKGREVTEDVRPVIRRIDVIDGPLGSEANTEVIMELSTQPRSAKPGEILAAIARVSGGPGDLVEARTLRTHQWIERDGTRCEPHDADTRPRARWRTRHEGRHRWPSSSAPTTSGTTTDTTPGEAGSNAADRG